RGPLRVASVRIKNYPALGIRVEAALLPKKHFCFMAFRNMVIRQSTVLRGCLLCKIDKCPVLVVELWVGYLGLPRLLAVIRLSQTSIHEFQLGILRMGKQGCTLEPIEAGILVNGLKDETPE